MWEIAICDSDEAFAKEFGEPIRKFYEERGFKINIKWYSKGAEFTESVDKPIHLVFMNTRLSDMKGFALAEMLRVRKPKAQLIFLSDNDEDVFEAFRYHPLRFIRKAVWREEMQNILEELWRVEHTGRHICLKKHRKDIIIRLEDLVYLESKGHYVYFHCADHNCYHTREKLSFYKEMLQGRYFIQPTQSFLVNCAYVESLGTTVTLRTGERFNCSCTRKAEIGRIYQKYVDEIAHYL